MVCSWLHRWCTGDTNMAVLGVHGVDLKLIKPSRCPVIIAPSKSPKSSLNLRTAHTTCQISVKHSCIYNTVHSATEGNIETVYLPEVTAGILVEMVPILLSETTSQPDRGGEGGGKGAMLTPDCLRSCCFLYRYDPSTSTIGSCSVLACWILLLINGRKGR